MEATILLKNVTYTLPPVVTMRYQDPVGVGVGAAYTELLELPLFAVDIRKVSTFDSTDLTLPAYAIDLISVAISCGSDKFTAKILDKDDISLLRTIDEVYSVADISRSDDRAFLRYGVQNVDDVRDNKLYLHITNNGTAPTGPISLELKYTVQRVTP